ncbi:MAG: hypothetical protein WC856_23600 [Methylococcaceae bacterium]|jgi:hypothetical protein
MSELIAKILYQLNLLIEASTRVDEQSYRITIEGDSLNTGLIQVIKNITQLSTELKLEPPVILIEDESVNFQEEEDEESLFLGQSWRLIFAKTSIAKQLKARENESTFLFISLNGFQKWLKSIDPFVKNSNFDPDFSGPVTFLSTGA